MSADDLLDPFPMSEGHRRAIELAERLRAERNHELRAILERVATHTQSAQDVRLLAEHLGIRMTVPAPIFQD